MQLPPHLPPAPAGALRGAVWHQVEATEDGAQLTILDVRREAGGLVLHRQVWWEEDRAWSLDASDEWWLPEDAGAALADRLAALRSSG
jgi:hypothetical protein